MIALDIIKSAYRKVGALSRGFTLSNEDAAEGLEELNAMLAGYANEDLIIPFRTSEKFPLTSAKTEYTWGIGGDFNSATPINVLGAYLDDGLTSYQLWQYTLEEWNREQVKSTTGIPEWFNYDYGDPLGNIRFEHAPDTTYSFNVQSLKPITQFTALTVEDSFPESYVDMIRNNLAVRIAPDRMGEDAPVTIIALADKLLNAVKDENAAKRVPMLELDMALKPTRRFNINSID